MKYIKQLFSKSKFSDFKGKASRAEYWKTQLALCLIGVAYFVIFFGLTFSMFFIDSLPLTIIVGIISFVISAAICVFGLVIIIPTLALTVRRLNDAGLPWFSIFVALIPFIGTIILFYLLVKPSVKGINEMEIPNSVTPSQQQSFDYSNTNQQYQPQSNQYYNQPEGVQYPQNNGQWNNTQPQPNMYAHPQTLQNPMVMQNQNDYLNQQQTASVYQQNNQPMMPITQPQPSFTQDPVPPMQPQDTVQSQQEFDYNNQPNQFYNTQSQNQWNYNQNP